MYGVATPRDWWENGRAEAVRCVGGHVGVEFVEAVFVKRVADLHHAVDVPHVPLV